MDKTGVSAALQALARSDDKRPETARLRDVFDDVEAALAAGVSRADVLAALHEQGFKMTLRTFDSALYRIRKDRAKGRAPAARPAPAGAASTPHTSVSKISDTRPDLPHAGSAGTTETAPEGDAESNDGLTQRQRRERFSAQFISDKPKPRFTKKEGSK